MRTDLSDILTVPTENTEWFDHDVIPELLAAGEDVTSGTAQEALIRLWVRGQTDGLDTESAWRYTKNEGKQVLRRKSRPEQRERFYNELWWETYNSSPGLFYDDGYELYVNDMLLDVAPYQRDLIILWAIEGYTISAAAKHLGIPLRTAERWVSENRALLSIKWRDLY